RMCCTLQPALLSIPHLPPAPSTCALRFFLFNDTATTQLYTLSLHDALPIYDRQIGIRAQGVKCFHRRLQILQPTGVLANLQASIDRKSTRLNSSHEWISYAVFCLKKKNKLGRRCRFVPISTNRP